MVTPPSYAAAKKNWTLDCRWQAWDVCATGNREEEEGGGLEKNVVWDGHGGIYKAGATPQTVDACMYTRHNNRVLSFFNVF